MNGHVETVWPSLFRKVQLRPYVRERIFTHDNDFLDLDWLKSGSCDLAIISHGLEGDSQRHYVVGMARSLLSSGWDVLAWNFRGCGGDVNQQPRFTHNGATDDLDAVVQHACRQGTYQRIILIGFSMGGNLTLVYLGRLKALVPKQVKCAFCFSVPCDLAAAAEKLSKLSNALYMKRFLFLMGKKVKRLANQFPGHFDCHDYHKLKTFYDFDQKFTAPLHGFRDARQYWRESSGNRYLCHIEIPTWVINARNDPFLSEECYPKTGQHGNRLIRLVVPNHGGHCGFTEFSEDGIYWSEKIVSKLISDL